MFGNLDCNTCIVYSNKSAIALPPPAMGRLDRITIPRNGYGDAAVVCFAKSAFTFPPCAIGCICQISVFRYLNCNATAVLCSKPIVAFPPWITSKLGEIPVFWDLDCQAGIPGSQISPVALPFVTIGIEIGIFRYVDLLAELIDLFEAA